MRANLKANDRDRGGAALVIIMVIIMVMAIAGASMIGMAGYQVRSVQRLIDRIKAEAIAEAGAAEAYAILREDFSKRYEENLVGRLFEGGVYDFCVAPVGDHGAKLWGKGEYPAEGDDIVGFYVGMNLVDVHPKEGSSNPPPSSPWAHSIFVNGALRHNGAGILTGSVRCNNIITCNGAFIWGLSDDPIDVYAYSKMKINGAAIVHGTVYTPKLVKHGAILIDHEVIGPIELVEFPVLDLTPYYQIAEDNGQVFSGRTYYGAHNWGEIPGGVRWYNGNVRFNGTLTYSGCLIATGYIQFNGCVIQSRVEDLPAVISRDSYIKINGASILHGLIYSGGDLRFNGADLVLGSMLVGGNARFNGAYGQIGYEYSQPGSGGGGGDEGEDSQDIAVTAWYGKEAEPVE